MKHVEILRSADGDWVAVAVDGELAHSEHDFDDASLPGLLRLLGWTVTEVELDGDTDEFDEWLEERAAKGLEGSHA